MNSIVRICILAVGLLIAGASYAFTLLDRSPYVTGQGMVREQPVPFSHEHHVRGLGLDCRFCHSTVENAHSAGMPSTKTCMTCHSKIWTDAPALEPVRASWRENRPIAWTRVHLLPDFVYFDHSIHIAKGVSCYTCHGKVNEMPLMYQSASLQMRWCLDCHRNPGEALRPQDQLYNANYEPPADQKEIGRRLIADEHIKLGQLTNCYICHR